MTDEIRMTKFLEEIMAFASRTGITYMSGNIYGGFSGFWDYGPIGVEIKNRIKEAWWNDFVRNRDDIVGYDGAVITHPKVWEASGHVNSFNDPLVFCQGKCKKKYRLDHVLEDLLKIKTEDLTHDEMGHKLKENNIKCPNCDGELGEPTKFSLMFQTEVGAAQESSAVAYLRPENAQLIFSGFKNVIDSTRVKMPFGIAHSGVVFRNEISPRNFLFRVREYELMEFEYFTDPDKTNDCPLFEEVAEVRINVYSREEQNNEDFTDHYKILTAQETYDQGTFKNKWQAYWLTTFFLWFQELGIRKEKLRFRQHVETELSHYALDTWDIDYQYPFGWKELMGCANRGQFDLSQHQNLSKTKMEYVEDTGTGVKRYIPYVVAEPSVGVGRILLTIIAEGYTEEEVKGRKRSVLKIHPRMAPYDVAVFPLQKGDKLHELSRKIFRDLRAEAFYVTYDTGGSIGKRYRRQDEIGTPFCVTIDYESLANGTVTIRNRDTMEQERASIDTLAETLREKRKNFKISYENIKISSGF